MNALDALISALRTLPGVSKRAAQKIALHLLLEREKSLHALQNALAQADQDIKTCHLCGNLDAIDPCGICTDPARNVAQLCIVPMVSDVWALERTKLYRGHYHVLGGVLSAINGITPAHLRLEALAARAPAFSEIEEVILALPASVEGASTAHHVMELMLPFWPHARYTRLAHGMPMGGHLDSLDEGTLSMALGGRSQI